MASAKLMIPKRSAPYYVLTANAVSYTHLTLPTN